MVSTIFGNVPDQRAMKPGFRLFRHFYLVSVAGIVAILVVASLGLRFIVRHIVLYEAERQAIRISATLHNAEMHSFIQLDHDKDQTLSITQEEIPEFDRHMRVCLAPFDIVKIKIFNTDKRIIYSTDSEIIGRLDTDNARLATALGGSLSSEYGSGDHIWDLDSEERKDVDIVETYVPLRGPDGNVVGSFEVYKNVTHDLAMADRILFRAAAVLTVTVLSVFGALMFVICRANQTITSSTANLMVANEQLLREIEERKHLERELLSIIEKERRWIGQELHDSIGQQLTGIELMTKVLQQNISKEMPTEAAYAAKIVTLVNHATEQTRDLVRGLYLLNFDNGDLISALERLAISTEHLFGLSCTLKCDRLVTIDDVSVATNLCRIAQEAITNAIKHGKAKNVLRQLVSNGDVSTLTVESDGLDFPAVQAKSKGMGLKIMNYRAEVINGSLNICHAVHGGTLVTCVFPNKNRQQ